MTETDRKALAERAADDIEWLIRRFRDALNNRPIADADHVIIANERNAEKLRAAASALREEGEPGLREDVKDIMERATIAWPHNPAAEWTAQKLAEILRRHPHTEEPETDE